MREVGSGPVVRQGRWLALVDLGGGELAAEELCQILYFHFYLII